MATARWASRLVAACLLATLSGCIAPYDSNTDFHTGEAARKRIFNLPRVKEDQVPASATDYRLFDGGTFGGSITYWTFTCASLEDCYRAVEMMGGPKRDEFQPWQATKYGVDMDGPGYYFKDFKQEFWPIRQIKNGVMVETVYGNHEGLQLNVIDLDRKMVFHHYESGGFPDGPPKAP